MKNKKVFLLVALLCSGIVFINAHSQSVAAASVTSVKSRAKSVNNADNQSDGSNVSSTTPSGQKDIQKQEQPNQENKEVKTPTSHPQSKNIYNQWVTRQGHNYYLINNKPLKGLRNINKSWYLFDKQGIMLTGVRKIPKNLLTGTLLKMVRGDLTILTLVNLFIGLINLVLLWALKTTLR